MSSNIPKGYKKVTIKCLVDTHSKPRWMHFCYVPLPLWEKFKSEKLNLNLSITDYVENWAQVDFKMSLELNNSQDLYMLKQYIWHRAQVQYPDVFREHHTDMQGWLRIWVCNNMRKELDNDNKARYVHSTQNISY